MDKITRRLFLRTSAVAGAAVAIAAPVVAAETEITPLEQAWWHIRELERLAIEDGGKEICIIVQAGYGPENFRGMGVNAYGSPVNSGMFASRGEAV